VPGGIVAMTWMSYSKPANGSASVPLADQPWVLKMLPTAQVIDAGLSKPLAPWAWQELDQRSLTAADMDRIVAGLLAWLRRDHPDGLAGPLNFLDGFLARWKQRKLISDAQAIQLLEAVHGNPRCEPLLRVREGQSKVALECDWRNIWAKDLLGVELFNEMRSVTVDGTPLVLDLRHGAFGDSRSQFVDTLTLPALAPGKHVLKLEILSALVATEDAAGLASDAPSDDWPPAKRRWTRFAQTELVVYPRDASIIEQTQDPALDPVAAGGLSVKQVIVRSKGKQARAMLVFDLNNKLPEPVSFDVVLKVGGQTIPCGTLWANKRADGDLFTYSGTEQSADLDALPPTVKEAEILLTPNPQAVEHIASITRIWGKPVVFPHVALSRQDLSNTAQGAH